MTDSAAWTWIRVPCRLYKKHEKKRTWNPDSSECEKLKISQPLLQRVGYFNGLILTLSRKICLYLAPKPVGRRSRKPGLDRKPRQAYSAKQLERLESEFKVF